MHNFTYANFDFIVLYRTKNQVSFNPQAIQKYVVNSFGWFGVKCVDIWGNLNLNVQTHKLQDFSFSKKNILFIKIFV